MQAEPIKPMSEAPGAKHLKLQCDEPPSRYKLRRYILAPQPRVCEADALLVTDWAARAGAGAYTRSYSST